jgi:hypothetical protein
VPVAAVPVPTAGGHQPRVFDQTENELNVKRFDHAPTLYFIDDNIAR